MQIKEGDKVVIPIPYTSNVLLTKRHKTGKNSVRRKNRLFRLSIEMIDVA